MCKETIAERVIGRKVILLLSILTALYLAAGPAALTAYAAQGSEGIRQSSFEYKKYHSDEEYKMALKRRMNRVYGLISDRIDESLTLPIPGLVETYSYKEGRGGRSDQFVPQGLCRAGDHLLITAYDAEKKSNTVIYAVDPVKKELVSTISLPNTYHAGGIAFDGENIWLTGDTSDKYKGNPFLQYISYDAFRNMIEEPVYKVSENEISKPVYIKNKPSFLEYNRGVLWVGTYAGRKSTKDAYMYGYRIIPSGDGTGLNTVTFYVISGLDSSAQGVDIEGNYLYLSSSCLGAASSVKSSFVTKYNIKSLYDGRALLNIEGREVKRIEVPKMNEEILVDDGCLRMNFESASEAWKSAVINTDRIIAVDLSLWD